MSEPRPTILVCTSGAAAGKEYLLSKLAETTIGAAPGCDVCLDEDDTVSRYHAKIVRREGGLFLEDLDSTNGTFHDGVRIRVPVLLIDGAEIRIGTTSLVLRASAPPAEDASDTHVARIAKTVLAEHRLGPIDTSQVQALQRMNAALRVTIEADHESNPRDAGEKRNHAMLAMTHTIEEALRSRLASRLSGRAARRRMLKEFSCDPNANRWHWALEAFLRDGLKPSLATMAGWLDPGCITPDLVAELSRILRVPPGREADILRCGLIRNVLAHRPDYEGEHAQGLGAVAGAFELAGEQKRLEVRPETLDWAIELAGAVLGRPPVANTSAPVASLLPLVSMIGHSGEVKHAAFSPDGRWVVTAGADGEAKLWARDQQLRSFREHAYGLRSAAFAPAGLRMVTAGLDRCAVIITIVPVAEGGVAAIRERAFDQLDTPLISAFFSPDGARIITVPSRSHDRAAALGIFDATTGAKLGELAHRSGVLSAAVLAPNGAWLAVANEERVELWDVRTGEELAALEGHADRVRTVSVSADGARIASGSFDETVKIWDTATCEIIGVISGDRGLSIAAISPDGTWLAAGHGRSAAAIWEVSTGEMIAVLHGHLSPITSVAFSADGRFVLTASRDATAKIWLVRR